MNITSIMKKLLYIAIILAAIACAVALFKAMEARDEALAKAAEQYENCVRDQYGTTPTAWRMEHGVYPTCESATVEK